MNAPIARFALRRWIASFLAILIALGPIATPSYAALTALADEPLNVRNASKPNIVLTVDDSTSMLFDFLPDYIINAYCRDGTGKMGAACGIGGMANDFSAVGYGRFLSPGYISQQWNVPYGAYAGGYDTSGPGAGCNLIGFPPKCSGGVDPTSGGSMPSGVERYPNTSPFGGNLYEYWTLWPAPVHNSAFNRMYYNPTLTYQPPVNADGTSMASMDAATTTLWTKVPADPWASPLVYVDLTAPVTVGQWCNSDWTLGTNPNTGRPFANDPAYCRTNGVLGAAAAGAPVADGDYMYPWLPPGIVTSNAPNIAMSIAYTKVNAGNLNAPTAAWTNAQDPKYFYETDNVIWCNTKSPLWPQGGNVVIQTCNGAQSQTCTGGTQQSCQGGTQQTCSSITQSCNGAVGQTCQNINNGQTCVNAKSQNCSGSTSQNCVGAKNDSCNGNNPQICKGYMQQSCGSVGLQSCNGVQPQTCANLHSDSNNCTWSYNPPGCNTCVGPECGTCTLQQTCPTVGNCSVETAKACTKDADCATLSGLCSLTKGACFNAADCPNAGQCTATAVACTSDAQCPDVMGTCDKDNKQCKKNGDCQKYGYCNIGANVCFDNTNCPTIPGVCSTDNKSCTANNQCASIPGTCTITKAACTSDTQCPIVPGTCSTTGIACTSNASCGATGVCSATNATCQVNADCPTIPGACNVTGTSCKVQTDCAVVPGVCSISGASCTAANQCPNMNMKCSLTNMSCGSNSECPVVGATCSITKSACVTNSDCSVVPGTCSISGASCTSTSQCTSLTTASASATCSDMTSDGKMSLFADAAGQGVVCRRNNQGYSDISAGRYNYPDMVYNTPVTGGMSTPVVWVEDAVPAGAVSTGTAEAWTWVTTNPAPFSGAKAHQSALVAGTHQHYFYGASTPLAINTGDYLFTYVYLDPVNPPTEIMLQWYDQFGSWEHRAYWGANSIPWGVDNTNSRRYMGPLPAKGQWVRLSLPASMVGLEGYTINGMAYTLFDGRATWDYAGKAASAAQTGTSSMEACVPTPRFTSIPRHYWKTSVEWCDKAIATAGDKWAGYGTSANGSCQSFNDTTHIYPRFYKFGSDPGSDNYATPAFERVDLDISQRGTKTYTHTWKDSTSTVQTITRTFDDEMTNYANWFAYYRTRIQAVKTVTSLAFSLLDDTYRVGFHTLSNNPTTSFVNIGDFTPAQKTAWWKQLNAISIKLNRETPNLDAIMRVGEYYKNGSYGALVGSTDPIVLSCQKNWHMLFTDGFTNQPKLPAVTYGNMDRTIPPLPGAILGLTPGLPWPPFYRENPNATSNSASDYTTYYWVTDLRTAGAVATNNVPTSDLDPASWQHQNFAALSLGTQGKLPAGNQSITEDQLKAGTLQWPQPYPNVYQPDQSGVDDLWHAAINGRGRFVNADSADELKLGMGQILADITNQAGSRAGVAFQSVNLSSNAKYIYRVRFEPGWGGSLTKVEIDPKTGDEVQEVWRAADQLTNQLLVQPGIVDTPWFTQRLIATTDETGKRVPFLWDNLTPGQQTSLSPKNTVSKAILEFLRGNRTNEGSKIGNFRVRPSPLGDIVDSQAVFVGGPRAPYLDTNDPGYSTFKAQYASRAARVYVGANDGMLHAFDDSSGNEAWAYVPLGAYNLANPLVPQRTLGALSYQDGGLPAFKHHFYVDSTPRIVDVDFGGGNADWRTLLVGGLGKGGKSYYAIDVTSPTDFTSEANVAAKIVWEFTDPDMGYSYGRPLITKTHATKWATGAGDRWIAILPSGYNNASGVGTLFFVDVATGKTLLTMSTGAGDPTNPSGLTHIAGYTKDYRNQMTEQIYAGDLNGNLWRFDISSSDIAKWSVAKIAQLTDPMGVPQPVTTPPQIEVDVVNGVDRWVFVGTGKLYDATDLSNNQIQSMYAIRDGTSATPNDFGGKVLARADLGSVIDAKGLAVKPDNGWYDDLPVGQRIVVPPQAALSVVTYSATSPQLDPCLTGQPATVYAREYARGDSVMEDANGNAVETYYSAEGGVGLELLSLDNVTASGVPNIVIGLTLGTTGKLKPINVLSPSFIWTHRMSWRLVGE